MMKHLSISVGRSPRDRRRASVLMEFLLVFPIILLLVSMLLQFSQIWLARQITAYAAYCAARATLTASTSEESRVAKAAATSVCAWMCFAGLPTDASRTLSETTLNTHWTRFHKLRTEVTDTDVMYADDGAPDSAEFTIPGLGSVPGSSSRNARVEVSVKQGGGSGDYAAVQVKFKFPLLFPLAGRIISWASSHPDETSTYDRKTGKWSGGNYYSIHSGWHDGSETVMNADGTALNRTNAKYGQDGKFPFIELTEICVLPRPYTTGNFGNFYYGGGI